MKNAIPLTKRIIFALDLDSVDEAKQWVTQLKDSVKFYKVGLQLFLAGGFSIIEWIAQQDCEVMLDLKFFDVPQTVAAAVRQLTGKPIAFATVHGNDAILKAAVQVKKEIKLLAVTVLTSLDQGDIHTLGFPCSVEELVASRAQRALEIGCDGVVSSGLEAPRLRNALGSNFLVVVPGVRPVKNNEDDQKRTVDMKQAFLNGADYVVVGRPIRHAPDPLAVLAHLQNDLQEALRERDGTASRLLPH